VAAKVEEEAEVVVQVDLLPVRTSNKAERAKSTVLGPHCAPEEVSGGRGAEPDGGRRRIECRGISPRPGWSHEW